VCLDSLAPSVLSIQQCGCVLGVDEGNVYALWVQELIELQRGVCSAEAWVGYDRGMGLWPHHCYCGGCSHGKATKGGELLLGWGVEGRASCSMQGFQSKGKDSNRKMVRFGWLCWGVEGRTSRHSFYRRQSSKENDIVETTSTVGRRWSWFSFSPP
jgi:hypothetical protein